MAKVPQKSPTSFPLSHLQDLPQIHRPVELSQHMCCESGVDGIGSGNGDGYTRSPMRGCFACGSVVSLCCVDFDTGSSTGKKGVVSNSTVGCDWASAGACTTCSFRGSGCFSSTSEGVVFRMSRREGS